MARGERLNGDPHVGHMSPPSLNIKELQAGVFFVFLKVKQLQAGVVNLPLPPFLAKHVGGLFLQGTRKGGRVLARQALWVVSRAAQKEVRLPESSRSITALPS